MSKHTPGSWVSEGWSGGSLIYGPHPEPGVRKHVASVYGDTSIPGEAQSNERLIVAAPDLLDALKYVADTCHKLANGAGVGGKATLGEIKERLRALRNGTEAIIAKVEGRQ